MTDSRTVAEEIAHRVRDLRSQSRWSQAQLAAEMSDLGFRWRRMTVTEIEGERHRPVSVEELLGLAHVFNVSVKHIVGAGVFGPNTPRLLEITPTWFADRSDALWLFDRGRRPGGDEEHLRERLASLEKERETETDKSRDIDRRLERLEEEIKATRHQLDAARKKAQAGSAKGRKR